MSHVSVSHVMYFVMEIDQKDLKQKKNEIAGTKVKFFFYRNEMHKSA